MIGFHGGRDEDLDIPPSFLADLVRLSTRKQARNESHLIG